MRVLKYIAAFLSKTFDIYWRCIEQKIRAKPSLRKAEENFLKGLRSKGLSGQPRMPEGRESPHEFMSCYLKSTVAFHQGTLPTGPQLETDD